MAPDSVGHRCRFGVFEFDPHVPELLKNGHTASLRPQALRLLALLLDRPGEVVSREEIQSTIWDSETFVDFEQGVNHCVRQIRAAIGDSAESPRYVQTLPRRGYRFIAPVEVIDSTPATSNEGTPPSMRPETQRAEGYRRRMKAAVVFGAALVAAAAGLYALRPVGGSSNTRPTLAVAPFSASGTDAAIGVGLANAISTRLASQRFAPVRPARGSGSELRDRASLVHVGRGLGATLVLSGEVSRTGDHIAVSTELTDVASGVMTWSGRFRVRADELYSVEDVVAERVAQALELRLAASEQDRLRRRYTGDVAAYGHYLRGRAALVEYTPDGTLRAVEAFEAALKQDPTYALARAGRAMACADMYLRFASAADVDRWGRCAESEAQAVLEVDPDLAEAYLARAAVARKREFDWSATISASRRALVLNPNLEQAHFFIAAAHYHLGHMDEALIEMERGRRLRGPDVVEPLRIEALVSLFSGSFAPALVQLNEVSRRSSQSIGDTYLALAYYYTGSVERARTMLETLVSHRSASTAARAGVALAGLMAEQGDHAAARRLIDRVLTGDYRDHHVAYSLGAAYAQLGEHTEALRWLGIAADTGFPCLIWFERDPLLEPVRRHAGFSQTLDRVRAQRRSTLSRLEATGP